MKPLHVLAILLLTAKCMAWYPSSQDVTNCVSAATNDLAAAMNQKIATVGANSTNNTTASSVASTNYTMSTSNFLNQKIVSITNGAYTGYVTNTYAASKTNQLCFTNGVLFKVNPSGSFAP